MASYQQLRETASNQHLMIMSSLWYSHLFGSRPWLSVASSDSVRPKFDDIKHVMCIVLLNYFLGSTTQILLQNQHLFFPHQRKSSEVSQVKTFVMFLSANSFSQSTVDTSRTRGTNISMISADRFISSNACAWLLLLKKERSIECWFNNNEICNVYILKIKLIISVCKL